MRRLIPVLALAALALVATWIATSSSTRALPIAGSSGPKPAAPGTVATRELVAVAASATAPAPGVEVESGAGRTAIEVPEPRAAAPSTTPGEILVVRILTADPDPLARRVRVSVALPERSSVMRTSDAEGRVEFDVVAGVEPTVTVYPSPAGRPPIVHRVPTLAPGERRVIEIEIPALPRVTFFGRVLDAERRPIEGAEVRLGFTEDLLWTDSPDGGSRRPAPERAAVSDAQGFFELHDEVLPFRATRIDAPGFAWKLQACDAGHPTRELAREVTLQRSASLAVRIPWLEPIDARLPMVSVAAPGWRFGAGDRTQYDVSLRDVRWMSPEVEGVARFSALPPGIELDVRADGIDPELLVDHPPVVLVPGDVREIDLRRSSAAALVGSLRDADGRPHARIEVWLLPRADERSRPFRESESREARVATTDGAGRFRFVDVPDGDWWVGASPASGCIATRWPVSVVGGLADRPLDLVTERGLLIEGRAVSWRSNPIAGGVAGAYNDDDDLDWHHTRVDSAGAFRLGPMAAGRYTLRVTPRRDGPDDCGSPEPLEVEAGASGLVVVCPPAARVCAAFEDPFDAQVEDVGYLVSRTLDNGVRQVVDPGGSRIEGHRIRSRSLEPGRYDLYVWTSEGRFAMARDIPVEKGIGSAEVRLALRAGGTLRVRYGDPAAMLQLSVVHAGQVVGGAGGRGIGTFDFTVPPGRVSVELQVYASGGHLRLQRDAVVPAGGDPVLVDFGDGP